MILAMPDRKNEVKTEGKKERRKEEVKVKSSKMTTLLLGFEKFLHHDKLLHQHNNPNQTKSN